jgi:hypothetical protein
VSGTLHGIRTRVLRGPNDAADGVVVVSDLPSSPGVGSVLVVIGDRARRPLLMLSMARAEAVALRDALTEHIGEGT